MRELGLRRMFLHAHSMAFTWPDTGKKCRIVAPLPADLQAVVEAIGKK
jgi:23S rRNA pseudouridine955/2504/2580 synthase